MLCGVFKGEINECGVYFYVSNDNFLKINIYYSAQTASHFIYFSLLQIQLVGDDRA